MFNYLYLILLTKHEVLNLVHSPEKGLTKASKEGYGWLEAIRCNPTTKDYQEVSQKSS